MKFNLGCQKSNILILQTKEQTTMCALETLLAANLVIIHVQAVHATQANLKLPEQ